MLFTAKRRCRILRLLVFVYDLCQETNARLRVLNPSDRNHTIGITQDPRISTHPPNAAHIQFSVMTILIAQTLLWGSILYAVSRYTRGHREGIRQSRLNHGQSNHQPATVTRTLPPHQTYLDHPVQQQSSPLKGANHQNWCNGTCGGRCMTTLQEAVRSTRAGKERRFE